MNGRRTMKTETLKLWLAVWAARLLVRVLPRYATVELRKSLRVVHWMLEASR